MAKRLFQRGSVESDLVQPRPGGSGRVARTAAEWEARLRRGSASLLALLCLGWLALPAGASIEDIEAKYRASAEAAQAGELEKAAQLSAEALALAETELGKDDPQTGILAYNTGVIYAELKNWKEARGPLEAALANYAKQHGDTSPQLLGVIDRLRPVYFGLQDVNAGSDLLERRLAIIEKDKGEQSKEAADAMREYGGVLIVRGKHTLARRVLRRALGVYEQIGAIQTVEAAQTYMAMGANEFQDPETGVSKIERVPQYFNKGIEIFEAVYDPGSPELIQLFDYLSAAYRGFGQEEEAEKYAARSAEQKKIAAEKKAVSSPPDGG